MQQTIKLPIGYQMEGRWRTIWDQTFVLIERHCSLFSTLFQALIWFLLYYLSFSYVVMMQLIMHCRKVQKALKREYECSFSIPLLCPTEIIFWVYLFILNNGRRYGFFFLKRKNNVSASLHIKFSRFHCHSIFFLIFPKSWMVFSMFRGICPLPTIIFAHSAAFFVTTCCSLCPRSSTNSHKWIVSLHQQSLTAYTKP